MSQQKNIITILENGPLQVEGEVKVYNTMSELVADQTPVSLCRCGKSNNKPFCDGSHEQAGFKDCCQVDNNKDEELDAYTPLTITCRPNGMLVVRGPMTIIGPDGKSRALRNKAALCRCGASRNKPFCDISHKKVGFVDDAFVSEEATEDKPGPAAEQAEAHSDEQAASSSATIASDELSDNSGPSIKTSE